MLFSFIHFRTVRHAPVLETIENTMKLSAMLVQALGAIKSPLLQLPHITESHLRHFETKKVALENYCHFLLFFF